ncbi:MAG: hypothetical protein R3C19_20295 [Planctomycetaceae bacterium]
MNPRIAEIFFASVMTAGVLVWAISLRKAANLGKQTPSPDDDPWSPLNDINDRTTSPSANVVTGERTVSGQPAGVSDSLARLMMTSTTMGPFSSSYEIIDRTSERLLVRPSGSSMGNRSAGVNFSEAEFTFERVDRNLVSVRYRLDFDRMAARLRRATLAIILGLGLPVLILVGSLIWHFVVRSANPGVRWQVLQTLQIVHVLWPPFLMMQSYKWRRTHATTFVSNLLASLELADA